MEQNTVLSASLPDSFYLQIRPNGEDCGVDNRVYHHDPSEGIWRDRPHMSRELLHKAIKEQVNTQPSKSVVFEWSGGEPLLNGIDFFRHAVWQQRSISRRKTVFNIVRTNGLLIDESWCRFFKENNFFVYVFFDTLEYYHNGYQNNRKQGNTFFEIIEVVKLLNKNRVNFLVQVSVTRYSAGIPLEIYRLLKEIGVRFMDFTPIAHRVSKADSEPKILFPDDKEPGELADWSVSPLAYGKFLAAIFDEWVRNDVGERFIKTFDSTLAMTMGKQSLDICEFSGGCNNRLMVDFDGGVYQCNQYISPRHKLGDLNEQSLLAVATSPERLMLAKAKLNSEGCKDCNMSAICNGYCPATRFSNPDSQGCGRSYYCEGLKHYFNHVKPYMDFMADEIDNNRPPANVMEFARERKLGVK